jgi:hypothetical protein
MRVMAFDSGGHQLGSSFMDYPPPSFGHPIAHRDGGHSRVWHGKIRGCNLMVRSTVSW